MSLTEGAVAVTIVLPAVILLVIAAWFAWPYWLDRRIKRNRRKSRFEHARLSRAHRREWRRFKRANKGLRNRSRQISGVYEKESSR